jgi:hypothetical protein
LVLTVLELSVVDVAVDDEDDPVPAAAAVASVMVITTPIKTASASKTEGAALTGLQHR